MKNAIIFYKWYVFFANFFVFMPVLINIFFQRGISSSQALLLEGVYSFTIILFEVPTGYIGDKIGHDNMVLLGVLGTLCCYVALAFSDKFIQIMVVQFMLGVFMTALSGSDVGSLSALLDGAALANSLPVFKSIYVISIASMCIAYVFSGILIKIDEWGRVIFLVTALVNGVAILFYILFIVEKRKIVCERRFRGPEEVSNVGENKDPISNMKMLFSGDILVCGILLGIVTSGYMISQVYYNTVGVDKGILGGIYCAGCILTIIFARSKHDFKRNHLFYLPLLLIFPLFDFRWFVIPFLISLSFVKARIEPYITNYVMVHSTKFKATNMSIVNMLNKCFNGLIMMIMSAGIGLIGFQSSIFVIMVIVLVCTFVIYRSKRIIL